MKPIEDHTQSLCPECLAKIDAGRAVRGDTVFLEKTCPSHGSFSTKIWKGEPLFENWQRPKIPKSPSVTFHDMENGCPFDCGLCPGHNQRSCTVILEVTERCNLHCPVCYADSGTHGRTDPPLAVIRKWFEQARRAAKGCNIQLSGGEPTLRDDLPEIVDMGKKAGFDFIQINTNGIRAARDDAYVNALKDAGLASVFLQFDGVDDDIYKKLRGRKLVKEKMAAIDVFGAHDIGVVLVPTLVPGVNTNSVGRILETAVGMSPVVRAVHFQPVSYFGRYMQTSGSERLTLPELMHEIEIQTGGLFEVSHFNPPGCENARCSFHGDFVIMPDGTTLPLHKSGTCCGPPIEAEKGALNSISHVARQWVSPAGKCGAPASLPGRGCSSPEKTMDSTESGLIRLDDFIERARTHTFSVSAMAFQDAWNLDIDRVRDCCIHIMSPDGRLVPFCLYNLTATDGTRLYRQ